MNEPINTSLTAPLLNASETPEPEVIPSIFAQTVAAISELSPSKSQRLNRFFRARYIAVFKKLKGGHITVRDPLGEVSIGDPKASRRCTLTMYDLSCYTKVALGGSNGSAQAYIDGLWSVDDLSALIRIFVSNRVVLNQLESGFTRVAQSVLRRWHQGNRNSRKGSRKNIAAHYDLGNSFFQRFLDQRMMYSSALYRTGDTLEQAAERKLQRICDTLELSANDHLVEIGSGWGGFACYAAEHAGCRVTTVTISKEQFEETQARIKREGLEHLVEVRLQDYRDIEGHFDKLVSIEMIEAVGHQYLDTYFNKINELLKPNGKALIQAIVIDDGQYQRALKQVDYIKRYIFPGGFMPCYSVIAKHAAQSRLMMEDMYDMGLSYAQTLRDWRKRFYRNIKLIEQDGYDARFQRMWEFYLCYCEGAFDERAISVGQLLFRKQANVS